MNLWGIVAAFVAVVVSAASLALTTYNMGERRGYKDGVEAGFAECARCTARVLFREENACKETEEETGTQ